MANLAQAALIVGSLVWLVIDTGLAGLAAATVVLLLAVACLR